MRFLRRFMVLQETHFFLPFGCSYNCSVSKVSCVFKWYCMWKEGYVC